MIYPLSQIDGIDPELATRLKKAGVRTSAGLLARAKDPKGRKTLALAAGASEAQILTFAKMADLMRVTGVGGGYAALLEAAGADTVKALKTRNVANLAKAMREANAVRPTVRLAPSEKTVAKWIAEAKTLPAMMVY